MPRNGGLAALADAFGRNPADNDEDYIRRNLAPYAIAGAQLGQYRDVGQQAIGQQYRQYMRDINRGNQGYNRRRNAINPMIGEQFRNAIGDQRSQADYGMGDLAAQGFEGPAPSAFADAQANAQYQIAGLRDRQRQYMANTRSADQAQYRDERTTGSTLRQAGRTAVQQSYADAMARLMIQKLQAQMQLRSQLDLMSNQSYGY